MAIPIKAIANPSPTTRVSTSPLCAPISESDADFVGAPLHRVGHHTVNADHGDYHREERESAAGNAVNFASRALACASRARACIGEDANIGPWMHTQARDGALLPEGRALDWRHR